MRFSATIEEEILIIQPDYTPTFEVSSWLFDAAKPPYVGEWSIWLIGLSKEYAQNTTTSFFG